MKKLKEFILIFVSYAAFFVLQTVLLYSSFSGNQSLPDFFGPQFYLELSFITNEYMRQTEVYSLLTAFFPAIIIFIYTAVIRRKTAVSRKAYYLALIASSFAAQLFSLCSRFVLHTFQPVSSYDIMRILGYARVTVFVIFIFLVSETVILKIGDIRRKRRSETDGTEKS